MAVRHFRAFGILAPGITAYPGLTDMIELSFLDLTVQGEEVEFWGTARTYPLAGAFNECELGRAGREVRALQRCALVNDLLTIGGPAQAYIGFGAAAFQHLGILPHANWICIGRCAMMPTGQGAPSLNDLARRRGIQCPDDLGPGAERDAWLTAALFRSALPGSTPERLQLLSTTTSRPCYPPPLVGDDEAWARVPVCELDWILSFSAVSGSTSARAYREQERRKAEAIYQRA